MESQSEQLLEALLDLERHRQRERELRLESEALLHGLRAMSEAHSTEEAFRAAVLALRAVFDFDDALILQIRADGSMAPIASTSPVLECTVWRPASLLGRVLAGRAVAAFDVNMAQEWRAQPEAVRERVRSALHIPLSGGRGGAILVCTHRAPRHFGPGHTKLVSRLAPLVSQALITLDLRKAVAERDRFFGLSLELMGISEFGGRFKQLNAGWSRVLGYSADELMQDTLQGLVHPGDGGELADALAALKQGGQPIVSEHRFRCADGTYRWLSCSLAAFPDENLYYIAARDVTDRVLTEQKLLKDARHDPLTGLSNRAVFVDRLRAALSQVEKHPHEEFAVLYLDLDRFKVINDSLGHVIGDRLLVAVADRLREAVPETVTVARLGGDEFIVLMPDIDKPSDVARMAQELITRLSAPVLLERHEVFTAPSIGITFSSIGYNNADDVLRDADIAMYAAKAAGRGQYAVFDRTMHERVISQLQLEVELRNAVDNKELSLHYQPIVDLASGAIVSFEALLRWQHPSRGLISPLKFIPIAEESGLIVPIGIWVIEQAARQVMAWRSRYPGCENLTVHVNVSARQFAEKGFVATLRRTLERVQVEPTAIVLEITESVILHGAPTTTAILRELNAMDMRIFLDDFGTGYSSLSYLHQFPMDGIKIDRSFVSNMERDNTSAELVNTILLLCQNLGLTVIAEGVETESQSLRLWAKGCGEAQGYLFSPAVTATQAGALLERGAPFAGAPAIRGERQDGSAKR
jgi:diguanylate cyclase (GGDEF)-like protein/PAS domain S-box-containing protein